MSRFPRFVLVLALLGLLVSTLPIASLAQVQQPLRPDSPVEQVVDGVFSVCTADRPQPGGAVYRICRPPWWWNHNGSLVIWAHGYVDVTQPIEIPEDQLCLEPNFCIPDIANFLGFDFATTSYSANGLAVVPGIADVLELVDLYVDEFGTPEHILLVGASEGGLITTLSVEGHPEVYDGGLAACGPIGDFRGQINYFGDFRAVLDYFFPGLVPGSPIDIPPELLEDWDEWYPNEVYPVLFDPANKSELKQLARVTHLPFDRDDLQQTLETSVEDALWYNIFATNNGIDVLGGQPFDNSTRWYRGSFDDDALNAGVQRFSAEQSALDEMATNYQTGGELSASLVTIHTTRDQQVPYWHDRLYLNKTKFTGSWPEFHFRYPPSDVYGHCAFPVADVLGAFVKLVQMVGGDLDSGQVEELRSALGPDTIVHLHR